MFGKLRFAISPIALTAALAACSPSGPAPVQKPQAAAKVAPAAVMPVSGTPVSAAPANGPNAAMDATVQAAIAEPPLPADQQTAEQAINQASQTAAPPAALAPPTAARAAAYDPSILRAEVLLDRAGFSPGVIDGTDGSNFRGALAAYAQAHGLPAPGPGVSQDPAVFAALTAGDPGAAMQAYQVAADDVAGPFIGQLPTDYRELAKLPALGYSGPDQLLAEKFHMGLGLLKRLNPDADFSKAGQVILVAAPRAGPRAFQVGRIEVDKSGGDIRVFDPSGALVAFYPATVGSTERPAPSGQFVVKAVAPRPAYYFDPARLTFAPQGATGKLRIAPGPNNPVGSTWIGLNVPTYGIHGAPDPELIGKRQSHGCVRLTNWDAAELGKAVKAGVQVAFVGVEAAAKSLKRG